MKSVEAICHTSPTHYLRYMDQSLPGPYLHIRRCGTRSHRDHPSVGGSSILTARSGLALNVAQDRARILSRTGAGNHLGDFAMGLLKCKHASREDPESLGGSCIQTATAPRNRLRPWEH